MNFFKRLKLNRQNQKYAKTFLELLQGLNSKLTTSFEADKNSMHTIYSDLPKEDLLKLKIPNEASYEWDSSEAYVFGHISILYHSKRFTIYAKGYGPSK